LKVVVVAGLVNVNVGSVIIFVYDDPAGSPVL
jgi:hypothetical protein